MVDLDILKRCELHVHTGGCLTAEDLVELGKDVYKEVNWELFINSYEDAFGIRPDPIALYRNALSKTTTGLQRFRDHFVFGQADGGDFSRFQAKFNFLICVIQHLRLVQQSTGVALRQSIDRHRSEGLDYVEYRTMYSSGIGDADAFVNYHHDNAKIIQEASQRGLTAQYLISLPRWAPLEGYDLVQRLLDEHPELIPTIVGLDFCYFEEGYPPETVRTLFQRLHADNQARPERALEVAYHVGESYFDKSLESAVRWCHEVAELGARRLGHAIALGLDPAIAVSRRPQAHEVEPVRERLDQIAYDLTHRDGLDAYGVKIDRSKLEREREALECQPLEATVQRPYTPERLSEVRQRQDFALACLTDLGTVIETCPTSNLRVGGVPSPTDLPVHRFLRSTVNLVIGADDPGFFDSPLATEVNWAFDHSPLDADAFVERLGDSRRFRLGTLRPETA